MEESLVTVLELSCDWVSLVTVESLVRVEISLETEETSLVRVE